MAMKTALAFRMLSVLLGVMLAFSAAPQERNGLPLTANHLTPDMLLTVRENTRMDIAEKAVAALSNEERPELNELYTDAFQRMMLEVSKASPEDIFFHSLSPDGNTMLASYSSVLLTVDLATLAVSVLAPDYAGSQFSGEYGFGEFNRFMEGHKQPMLDPSACIWSPDGRYLTLKSWPMAMMNLHLFIDLYVADVQEGRLYNAVTYPGETAFMDAAVIQAQFSADSSMLYYTVYSNITSDETPYRVTLCAYDMAEGTHRAIASGVDEADGQYGDLEDLLLMPDGSLIQLIDTPRISDPRGLFVYTPDDEGRWQRNDMEMAPAPLHSFELAASAQSGRGIIGFRSRGVRGVVAISSFQQTDGFAGMDTLLLIHAFDQPVAETIPLSGLTDANGDLTALAKMHFHPAIFGINPAEADPSILWEPEQPAFYPLAFTLSPSGEEALLLLKSPDSNAFGMVSLNLSDHTLRQIEADLSQISTAELETASAANRIGLEWRENGRILLQLRSHSLLLGPANAPS